MQLDYINKVAPEHSRLSCADDRPQNAMTCPHDGGGCLRCTLLLAAAPAPAGPEPGTWDYLIEELESGRTAGRIAAMKSNNAVLVAAKARIADLEAALRSVLDQPETAAAYDAMMQRVTDALAGAAPVQAEPSETPATVQDDLKSRPVGFEPE